jgi:hypothetical protein
MFAMIALAACLSSSIEEPPPPVPPLRPFVQYQLKVREAFRPLIGAFLDEVFGDALTRRLLPRGVHTPVKRTSKAPYERRLPSIRKVPVHSLCYAEHGMPQSFRRSDNCDVNAVVESAGMESLCATLKKELVHDQHFRTHEGARAAIFQWIEALIPTNQNPRLTRLRQP